MAYALEKDPTTKANLKIAITIISAVNTDLVANLTKIANEACGTCERETKKERKLRARARGGFTVFVGRSQLVNTHWAQARALPLSSCSLFALPSLTAPAPCSLASAFVLSPDHRSLIGHQP